jgi:phosphoribosylanthranilate isomerase
MINGTRLKVCGITSLVDAEAADQCGADYLGFILYPKSPRYLPLDAFKAMQPRLPHRKKVAVVVEPEVETLPTLLDAGFDCVQLHFSHDVPFFQVALWADAVPADRLWIAPRSAPGQELDPAYFPLANTILFDAYDPNAFGGTGKVGDWSSFVSLRQKYTRPQWILAGGLNPQNIGDAIQATQADFVDVNSGVEAAPGVKDREKLKAFVLSLHRATVKNNPAYGS